MISFDTSCLSNKQQEVVASSGKVILRACPGSGKTYTVSNKMYSKLNNWRQERSGIAVLSFTNVACEEINNQIIKLGIDTGIQHPHFLGTLDHFINAFIFLPFGHLVMGCTCRPKIVGLGASTWEQSIWKNAECNKMRCNIIDFTYDRQGNLININPDTDIGKCNLKLKPCTNYKKWFVANGYANQSDANYWAIKLLEKYPIISKLLALKFPEIIIDEAQDTSEIQMNIIDNLVQNGLKDITIVGDPDQAIYEWRQADPELFLDKMMNEEWNLIELLENRRSSQLICNATAVFSDTLKIIPKSVGETANYNKKPVLILYKEKQLKGSTFNITTELNKVKNKYIDLCVEENIPMHSKNVAILCRTSTILRRIMNLPDAVEPWNHSITKLLAKATYYRDIDNIKDSLNYIGSVISKICFGSLHLQDYEINMLLDGVMNISEWKASLYKLMISLPKSEEKLNSWVKSCKIEIDKWINKNKLPIEDKNNIDLKIKARIKGCNDYKDRSVRSFFEEKPKENISIETIHAAKGKTYESVMLVVSAKSKKGSIKQIAELQLCDEEIRTFYVGITRSRKLLVVAIPADTKSEYMKRFDSEDWDIISI